MLVIVLIMLSIDLIDEEKEIMKALTNEVYNMWPLFMNQTHIHYKFKLCREFKQNHKNRLPNFLNLQSLNFLNTQLLSLIVTDARRCLFKKAANLFPNPLIIVNNPQPNFSASFKIFTITYAASLSTSY